MASREQIKLSTPWQLWVVAFRGKRSTWPLIGTLSPQKRLCIRRAEEEFGKPWAEINAAGRFVVIKVILS